MPSSEQLKAMVLIFSFTAILFFGLVALLSDKEPVVIDPESVASLSPEDVEPVETQVDEETETPWEASEEEEEALAAEAPLTDPDPPVQDPRGLQALIQSDRLCDVYSLLAGQAVAKQELVKALLKSVGIYRSEKYAELADEKGPLLGDGSVDSTTPAAQFLTALRNGGLLKGSDWVEYAGNLQVAYNQLEALAEQDGDNGIFPYFQLVILQRLMSTDEQLLLRKGFDVLKARKFSPMFTGFVSTLEERARASVTQWVLVQELLKNIPRPTYAAGKAVVDLMASKVPGLREHLTRVMTEEGTSSRKSYRLYGYDPEMYRVGQGFAGAGLLPELEDLDAGKPQTVDKNIPMDLDASNCSPAKLTQLKEKIKFIN